MTRDGDRTRYELRIPLQGLAAQRILRASFLVNDADGAGREGWLEWTPGIGREKRPAMFGQVSLVARDSVPSPDGGMFAPDMGRVPPPPPEPLDGGVDAASMADPDDGTPPPDATAMAEGDAEELPANRGRRSDASDAADDGDGGCDCSTGSGGGGGWALLMLLALVRTRRDRA